MRINEYQYNRKVRRSVRNEMVAMLGLALLLFVVVFHPIFSHLAISTYESVVAQAVNVSVGVASTEINQTAIQLAEREQELANRERILQEREATLAQSFGGGTERTFIYFVLGFVLILLALILMNFYLDWRYRVKVS